MNDQPIAIVGAGALGVALAWALTLSGVRNFLLIDNDRVELSNLPRLPWAHERDLGDFKTKVLAQVLRRMGSDPVSIEESIASNNVERLLSPCSMVFDATDNWPARELLQTWSFASAKPWIYSSVLGLEGMTALFDPASGPCLYCLFSQNLLRGPRCFEAGVLGPMALAVSGQALRLFQLYQAGSSERGLYLLDPNGCQRISWPRWGCMHNASGLEQP